MSATPPPPGPSHTRRCGKLQPIGLILPLVLQRYGLGPSAACDDPAERSESGPKSAGRDAPLITATVLDEAACV